MSESRVRLLRRLKHLAVFVAAIGLIWLAGVLPAVLNPSQGAGPANLGAPTLTGLLSAWPIYVAVAIVQALTFHYVRRFASPVFLAGVFLLASLLAWRYAGLSPTLS